MYAKIVNTLRINVLPTPLQQFGDWELGIKREEDRKSEMKMVLTHLCVHSG
jgi:hypothetical protein